MLARKEAGATSPPQWEEPQQELRQYHMATPDIGSIELKTLYLLHEVTGSGNYNLIPRTAGQTTFSYF